MPNMKKNLFVVIFKYNMNMRSIGRPSLLVKGYCEIEKQEIAADSNTYLYLYLYLYLEKVKLFFIHLP